MFNNNQFDYVIDLEDNASSTIITAYSMPQLKLNLSFLNTCKNPACLGAYILLVGSSGNVKTTNRVYQDLKREKGFKNVCGSSIDRPWGIEEWKNAYPQSITTSRGTQENTCNLSCKTIDERYEKLREEMRKMKEKAKIAFTIYPDVDIFWLIFAGVLVFFMQAGFSLLESGAVRGKNVGNILYKNLMDAALGALVFWIFGFAFAYGSVNKNGDNGFIGGINFALSEESVNGSYHGFHTWFFQWAFAATAATIVSGAVAERTKVSAYFCYTLVLSGFIYPVVVHWVWDVDGWLFTNNFIDFAGSGVVHMVGGFSALMGALVVGPRSGRFGNVNGGSKENVELKFKTHVVYEIKGHSMLLSSLGVAILWVGWYGFNCGSTLQIQHKSRLSSKVAITTTLAAASGATTATIIEKIWHDHYDLLASLNGVLAGLVGITAGCAVVDPWMAVFIGVLAAFVCTGFSVLLKFLKVDDPLDAFPVHGGCGMLGVLCVGIFATEDNLTFGGYSLAENGSQFGWQLLGVLAIASWSTIMSYTLFKAIDLVLGVRVDEVTENKGLDICEHGGKSYRKGSIWQ